MADARINTKDELFEQFDSGDRTALWRATDAELVLYCYQRWGCQCLEHFIGDFSFAIWDQRNRCIFCARDPFGVKPLFYSATSAWLVFSHTLDCVRVHPDIGNDLDRQAIADFLLFGRSRSRRRRLFPACGVCRRGTRCVGVGVRRRSGAIGRYRFGKRCEPNAMRTISPASAMFWAGPSPTVFILSGRRS